jgi:hypothetical protein
MNTLSDTLLDTLHEMDGINEINDIDELANINIRIKLKSVLSPADIPYDEELVGWHIIKQSTLLSDMLSVCGNTSEILNIPEEYTPESIRLMCEYMRLYHTEESDNKFINGIISNLVNVMNFLKTITFFGCEILIKITQIKFIEYYIKGKTPETCLEACGLPSNTVFPLNERKSIKEIFPYLNIDFLATATDTACEDTECSNNTEDVEMVPADTVPADTVSADMI